MNGEQRHPGWPGAGIDAETATGIAADEGAASKKRSSAALIDATDAPAAVHDTRVRPPLVREVVLPGVGWTTRIVRDDAQFEALREAWAGLLDEAGLRNVFVSHEWMFTWWTVYRPRADLAIVVVERAGRVRGIAPLMIATERRAGLRLRVLRLVGDGSGETDHTGFVVSQAERGEVHARVFAAIADMKWDVAEFNRVFGDCPDTPALLDRIGAAGLACKVDDIVCPVRRLPGTFEALLATLPSRLRTSVRSSRRKLQQEHTVEFGLHENRDELEEALDRLFANHESRWRGKGQAGVFTNPQRREFYRRLTPRLLARGWLRFFHLTLDGETIAQQYCFAVDGTVMLLQEGFDFRHARDNVGNVLRSLVFEHLIASGATCYDFLAGTSRHKQSWSDGTAKDLRIRFARRSWRGRLFFDGPVALERLKDALRPLRDRWRRATRPARDDAGEGRGR